MALVSWFAAVWYVVNQKNGVSALGLQRVLGFGSYQTAWAWLHKLRRAMVRPGRELLDGPVEVDETLIGGVKPGRRGRGWFASDSTPQIRGLIRPHLGGSPALRTGVRDDRARTTGHAEREPSS